MLKVKNITVNTYVRGVYDVSWEVENTTEETSEYRFIILRSGGPVGPFDVISPELEDQYAYTDSTISRNSFTKDVFYKIRVKKGAITSDFPEEQGVTSEFKGDVVSRELVRREWLRLHLNVASVIVYPVRKFGTFCPYCTSSGVRRRTSCSSCYGTTYLGGFFKPFEIPAEEMAEEDQIIGTSRGVTSGKQTEFKVPPSPRLKPGDFIVDQAGLRWVVARSLVGRHVQAAVMQRVLVDSMDLNDPRYEIDAPVSDIQTNTSERLKRRADT